MPSKLKLRNGDVFETVLPDGRFGAIRIIKTEDVSFLIATTPYISTKPPEISDPQLKAILHKTFGKWQGKPELCGYRNAKLQKRRYVGNIPLSSEEELVRLWFGPGGHLMGSWGDWVGQAVHRQWQWDHACDAYEEERRQEEEKSRIARDVQPKPKKMMNEEKFWRFISLLDWNQKGDDEAVIAPVIAAVAALRKNELNQFSETFSYKLFLLDTPQHAKCSVPDASDDWESKLSADEFLYSRCVVMANGQEFYQKVLENPSAMPKDLEFEALLSIVPEAYAKKTGSEDSEYSPGCSYETFSNRDAWRRKPQAE